MLERPAILLSCEHGGNRVPGEYQGLFADAQPLLDSHRGYDIGILPLAQELARKLGAPLVASDVTRLLVDLNRSKGHPRLFSELTRHLPKPQREQLLHDHYLPYRKSVRHKLEKLVAGDGAVIHLSVHSFTPELDGRVREVDIGLLYDSRRPAEVEFCGLWREQLKAALPQLRIRRNLPYRGSSDGLVTDLRKDFTAQQYLGIELEVNQALPLSGGPRWQLVQRELVETLKELLE